LVVNNLRPFVFLLVSNSGLSVYHYRVSQLSLKLFQYLVIQIAKDLARQNSRAWHLLLV